MMLYETLKEYTSSDAYPFHMPGHKRRGAHLCDPARIDITEIDGFDNLHHAEGILQEAMERAAALYHSEETYFLVNGSTAGVLSAVGALTRPGGILLMARNSHRSAFNAAALNRLRCAYLYPGRAAAERSVHHSRGQKDPLTKASSDIRDINGPIDPGQVAQALDTMPDVSAVFLTSPTYDGVVSDIASIARITHRHGIPLIVDEAHGAHFGMHRIFPKSSVELGADVVIHSLHKTLPALTQTGLIHVNGSIVSRGRLRRMLSVYQTSSPSYVLMSSIDACIHYLARQRQEIFDAYARRLDGFYNKTRLAHFSFLKTDDPSRILIRPLCMDAMELYRMLRERFHIQPEMAAPSYVLMLSSVCDDDEGFTRLSEALHTLDSECRGAADTGCGLETMVHGMEGRPDIACTIDKALDADTRTVAFPLSEGMVSAEFLFLYPPGVPLLVPGERITAGIIRQAKRLKERGCALQGPEDYSLQKIRVVYRG